MSSTEPTLKTARGIPPEPYPALRSVLEKLAVGIQGSLKCNLLGAYLVGSLATGDFDLDSDVDFLVVTNRELTNSEVQALRIHHLQTYGLDCYSAKHLEVSYISREVLNRPEVVGLQPLWYIDNGSTTLERSTHDNKWHVRWILRERAITLLGPDPQTLLQPVSFEAPHAEIVTTLKKLGEYFAAKIGKPLGYFNTRFGQSFAVLTCCRMLHTLQSGAVQSKLAGVRWAEQALNQEWHELIWQAWTERNGVRFCQKIHQPADPKLMRQTTRFLAYAQHVRLLRNCD